MSETARCIGCGGDAENVLQARVCAACAGRVQEALSVLRPHVVGPVGEALSDPRRAALRRAREIGRWAAETAGLLARADLPDGELGPQLRRVDAWWRATVGSRTHRSDVRNEIVARVAQLGIGVGLGAHTLRAAAEELSRAVLERWPDLERASRAAVEAAIQAWASDDEGRRAGRRWVAVTKLLAQLGVVKARIGADVVRRDFHRWMRRQPSPFAAVLGIAPDDD